MERQLQAGRGMLQGQAPRMEIKHLQRTPRQEREEQLTSPK